MDGIRGNGMEGISGNGVEDCYVDIWTFQLGLLDWLAVEKLWLIDMWT